MQARGRLVRLKKLLWLRLEQHHQRRPVQCLRLLGQLADNRLMAEMYAVEVADRGHTTAMTRPQVVQSANEFHETENILRYDRGRLPPRPPAVQTMHA